MGDQPTQRLQGGQVRVYGVIFLLAGVLLIVVAAAVTTGAGLIAGLTAFGAANLLYGLSWLRLCLIVSPSGVIVRGFVRSTTVPWSEIASLEVVPSRWDALRWMVHYQGGPAPEIKTLRLSRADGSVVICPGAIGDPNEIKERLDALAPGAR